MSHRNDFVNKNQLGLSRDAELCTDKLYIVLERKYYSRLGHELVNEALVYFASLAFDSFKQFNETNEAREAVLMFQRGLDVGSGPPYEQVSDELERKIKQLTFDLNDDVEFECGDDAAGISMFAAVLQIIKKELSGAGKDDKIFRSMVRAFLDRSHIPRGEGGDD